MNKLGKRLLVDRVMEAYVGWREACLHVSDAYASWSSATGITATVAFGRYMAMLDREEEAADIYACLVRRASHILANEHDPAESRGGSARGVGTR